MRNIIFFASYYEAIKELPEEKQGAVYKAIIDYAMEGIEPNLTGLAKSVFILIKPYIDSSRKKQESGSKGGKAGKKTSEDISKSESEILSKEESEDISETPSNQIIKNEEEYEDKKEDISKKEIKKEKNTILTDSELISLIENEFSDKDVCQKFKDYALMRKGMGKNKAIRTEGTFNSCVIKLRKYALNKEEALGVLDNSISNCYQGLFDIFKHMNKTSQQESIPYAN